MGLDLLCGPYDCKMHFSTPLGNWEKKKLYPLQVLQVKQLTWCHTVKLQVERDPLGLGFCFYWGWGWGPRVLWAHSLLVNLNLRVGIQSWVREKTSGPKGKGKKSDIIKTKKPELSEVAWLFIWPCGWQCVIQDSRGSLRNRNLSPLQERGKNRNRQHLYYMRLSASESYVAYLLLWC